jgi:hypothetical protein
VERGGCSPDIANHCKSIPEITYAACASEKET